MNNEQSTMAPNRHALRLIGALGAAFLAAACSPSEPRSYEYFLENKIVRDGALARCDRDPAAARTDIECANARRAALAVQLQEERARRQALERESAETARLELAQRVAGLRVEIGRLEGELNLAAERIAN